MPSKKEAKGTKSKKKAVQAPKSAAQRIKEGKIELSEEELAKVSGGITAPITKI